jgi:hypothetical protein
LLLERPGLVIILSYVLLDYNGNFLETRGTFRGGLELAMMEKKA